MYQSQQYQLQQTNPATLMAPASLGEVIAVVVGAATIVLVFVMLNKVTKHLK